MKNVLLLFVIFVMFFSSCRKDENLVNTAVDTEAIRAQLVALPILTKDQVEATIAGPKLKDGPLVVPVAPMVLVEIFDLDPRTYEINVDYATKNFVYYEIDENGYRLKFLTIHQVFAVKNGQADLNNYRIEYEVGCSYSRNFNLSSNGNLSQVTYFFHFNNGKQFSYFGNGTNGIDVKLPPIANGKWKLVVDYFDDLQQQFETEYVDYYNQLNVINVILNMKSKNVVSSVGFDKNMMQGVYNVTLRGKDKSGYYQYITYRFVYDKGMPAKVTFDAPFDIESIYVYGSNGYQEYFTKDSKYRTISIPGGLITYYF